MVRSRGSELAYAPGRWGAIPHPGVYAVGAQKHTVGAQKHTVGAQKHTVGARKHTVGARKHTVGAQTHTALPATHPPRVPPHTADALTQPTRSPR